MYYPGSADPNRASALDLHAGDELPGIDFTLIRVKTFNVKGRVYDAVNSRPGIHTVVLLEPRIRRSSEMDHDLPELRTGPSRSV